MVTGCESIVASVTSSRRDSRRCMKWNPHDANLAFACGRADCLQSSSSSCADSTSSRVNLPGDET